MLSVRLTERLGYAPDLWNNATNFLTKKLEVYVIFFPKLCMYVFFQSLAAQGCQFHSFRYSAVENIYEERLHGWQIIYSPRVHLCYPCFWYTSYPAHSRGLLWALGQKGWRTECMTFYKNLRRQVIISTLELHFFSLVPLVSLLGMEILTLLALAESEVYFWKLLKNNWGVPFTFSHILELLFHLLKVEKNPRPLPDLMWLSYEYIYVPNLINFFVVGRNGQVVPLFDKFQKALFISQFLLNFPFSIHNFSGFANP